MWVPAHVYFGGRRAFKTEYKVETYYSGHLSDRLTRMGFDRSRGPARGCEHKERGTGFAYVEWMDKHGPIEFCTQCLTITRGRNPWRPEGEDKPGWDYSADDVILNKWHKVWPKEGKPRAKKAPPLSEWPDAY